MICRRQLGQKLGGEGTQGEGWGLQENKLVLAVFLASALLLAGQLHNPQKKAPIRSLTEKIFLHLRRATVNAMSEAIFQVARSRLCLRTPQIMWVWLV